VNTSTVEHPKLISVYARTVDAFVAWLTPKRLKVYPAALILGVVIFIIWVEILALKSGQPFSKTLGQDFKAFYIGGRFFLEGDMAKLYDFSAQRDFLDSRVTPVTTNDIAAFVYPPITAVLFAPFVLGDYAAGLLLWWGVGLLTLALSLYLLRREFLPSTAPSTGRLLLTSFLFYPTLAWFLYGQNSALTLLLYSLTFVLLRRGRDLAAGAALGLLLYKPQLAIALGVVLLVKWRWRALIGGALTAGLGTGIGYAINPAATSEFIRITPVVAELVRSYEGYNQWALHSLYEFPILLLDGFWRTGASILAVLLTAGGLLVLIVWWRRTPWQPGTRAWDLTLAATVALGLLISPHLYLYDLMLLLLPLAIVWSYYFHGTAGRPLDGGPLLVWTAVLYVAVFASSYLTLAQQQLSHAVGLPEVAVQLSVPVIFCWTWLVTRSAQRSVLHDPALANSG